MKRREFIAQSALPLAGAALISATTISKAKAKSFRVAHISDIHAMPGSIPETGMAKALQKVQSLGTKEKFIINSGDSIMDALETDRPSAQSQWKIFQDILKKENSLPIYHAIGNHDIWGWFNKSEQDKQETGYGKKWAIDELKIPNRYYSFDHKNWTFIVLDSTQLNPSGGYIANLDDEQVEWLKATLPKAKDRFVCIVSHIPILSICAGLIFQKTEANGDLLIKRNIMHSDFFKVKDIFKQFPNIKVCISGHVHLQDEVNYLGIKYYCNGAVSGNWWKGTFQEFAPAFATLDFFDDGTVVRAIVEY